MSERVDYQFPLRPNFTATLVLPDDLTRVEASRIYAMLATLVVEEDK